MPVIVRKNIVTISAAFVATDGSTTQPTAGRAVLTYKDQAGTPQTTTITLTQNVTTKLWVGTWDSSAAGQGTVFWMAWGYGTLQASAEGSFDIEANSANTV